ncbi:MAG TPA: glucodextranase DOMON-like domain-containing protein [Streptosporangiaceae bacterium]|nr:glucodextranase DOMON-like domain-containing protein [Streptosporangiaceae bacterium]
MARLRGLSGLRASAAALCLTGACLAAGGTPASATAASAAAGTATAGTATAGAAGTASASTAGTSSASRAATAHAASAAPGAPGTMSYFDLARKDCVGTAENSASKVWYTVAGGVLSDVYEPTIDNTNVSTLQYIVSDGSGFTDLQTRDMTYTVAADPTGMACTVTATSTQHGYRLVTTYITDPTSDSVLMHTRLEATPGSHANLSALHVYARLDAHANGNGGGGASNAGGNTGVIDTSTGSPVPVVYSTSTVTNATNRDYAVPTYMALRSSNPGPAASVGYAGTASDGLSELDASHTLSPAYTSAPDGHIVATQELSPGPSDMFTLALGFGRSQGQAMSAAGASLGHPFSQVKQAYLAGWASYDSGLHQPPASYPSLSPSQAARLTRSYYLSANVLRASEDKTYPGAIVASLASPWGQAVTAGATSGGKPVYFGSYREVFARDLYEAFTGLLADGDMATARAATLFLFDKQQLPSGQIPRNSLVNGKAAPDTGGDQLDETSYPILMALQSGLGGNTTLWQQHIRPAADFLVAHGPSFGVERWEEQSGYSPSTIAAEIAGLTAASAIASGQGDQARAQLYQATADDFQRNVKNWTVTTTGQDAPRYFMRLSKTGDPNAAISYNLGNGGPTVDQRSVIDGGFQELTRLGELPISDPDIQASLKVLDKQISVSTPSGTGYYRYGTSAAAGSADGYGDCYQPSQTSCSTPGEPWPTTDTGTGHLWPVLSGERAESDLAMGDKAGAASLLEAMTQFSSGVGLVPEQAWEDPNLPPSPYGSDPATASIGFTDGKAAGSASPLTWAQAQEVRLILGIGAGHPVETPSVTTDRYVTHPAPGAIGVTLTSPASGATISTATTTVSGTTAPGASVVVESLDTTTGAAATTATTTAAGDGTFSVTVPVGFGDEVLTATATASGNRTGYAQVAVTGDVAGGTTVLDVTDPVGDDNGPGTYQYPTAADFHPGSFDLTRFQIISDGSTVYLRTTLRNLDPTFGNTMGAQLLDIYVHTPGAANTSTSAAYATRNYSIAPAGAWSQLLEVQGFAPPVWNDAAGNSLGTPLVVASQTSATITIAVPSATFGTPTSGWSFAVVLTGQDGFSHDQARTFAPTPQPYQFGVCATTSTSPICMVDPATVPKAMDVITPSGVSQATELDPTKGPVVIQGVPIK